MVNILDKIKKLPLGVKVSEIIYLIMIIFYIYMRQGGGLTTTFYSFMAVVVTAAVTSIYLLFFKKNNIFAIGNLLIGAIIFIQLASSSI